MSTRVAAAVDFVVGDRVQVPTAARVMQVSRQAVYQRMAPAPRRECAPALRTVAPLLPEGWQVMDLGPDHCDVDTAIHVLARRHPAAGYRKVTARALIEDWRIDYNWKRPHSALGNQPPAVFAAICSN